MSESLIGLQNLQGKADGTLAHDRFTSQVEMAQNGKRKVEAELSTSAALVKSLETDKIRLSESIVTAQSEVKKLNSEIAALESRPDDAARVKQLEIQVSDLEGELEEMKHSLDDADEELQDAKARETKSRNRLMEEIEEAQSEASKLRTQLRSEQRKKGSSLTPEK